jgi:hypothetical protein
MVAVGDTLDTAGVLSISILQLVEADQRTSGPVMVTVTELWCGKLGACEKINRYSGTAAQRCLFVLYMHTLFTPDDIGPTTYPAPQGASWQPFDAA